MSNKFILPIILASIMVVAGVVAFMPVEKAATVHSTLSAGTDGQNRAMYFSFNQSYATAGTSLGTTIIPAETGQLLSGSFILSATPTNSTAAGGGVRALSCGLTDTSGSAGNFGEDAGTNATTGNPQSGTLGNLNTGEGLNMQIETSSSDGGGICEATIIIDSFGG